MSTITLNFTMTEWQKLVSAGLSDEIFRCIAASEQVHRGLVLEPSIVAVADSDTEEYQLDLPIEPVKPLEPRPLERGLFATMKTAEFAAKHNITESQILTPSGKNGKITMDDVKKAMPPKKRGRKPKAAPEGDMVDSLISKPKKAKKVKDPNAPKRAGNAWFFYLGEQRAIVKAANPEVKGAAQIVSLVGKAWNAMTAEGKAPYEAHAAQDKQRYADEKAAYDLSKANPESEADLAHEIAELAVAEKKADAKAAKAANAEKAKLAKAEKAAKAKAEKAKLAKAEKAAKAKAEKAKALKEQLAALEESQAQDDDEIVFVDLDDESDDELDEELVQFEFPAGSGKYFYRSSDDFVFEEEDGPAIGHWDEDDEIIIYDE